MSAPVDVTGGPRRSGGAVERVGSPSAPARTGAARRAYEKRQRRARALDVDTATTDRRAVTARVPFVAAVIGLLAIGLACTLLLSTRAAEESYRLSDARAENQRLTEQAAALQRDVELAGSAPELARRAAELGMIPTKDVPRLVVQPDGVVQVIGTPAPAAGPPAPAFSAPAASPTRGAAGPTTARTGTGAAAAPGATPGEALTPLNRSAAPTTTTPAPANSAPAAAPQNAAPQNAAPQNAAPQNAAPQNAAPQNPGPVDEQPVAVPPATGGTQ
ncbi:hypothetical protein ACTHQY_06800 [Rhodococcoides corynebacterioides]|uniref:hypothetical protein n=1 Tax=Rhodococcoides corynebacterioides TaxID=53972 RepID=UPI003F7FCD38